MKRITQRWARACSYFAHLAAVAGLLSAPDAPRAAESNNPTGRPIEEVVVTARRRDERAQDVPVAITPITREMLERYSVTDVISITQMVPSMVVGRQVTGSSASIFLRGVGSTSLSSGFEQSVSLNLDGLAMSRGREIVTSMFDIEQVEVLKGPQALFFGRNSTGGVISVRSALPTETFEGSATAGYEFEADERFVEGVLSGPIADTFRGRLAVRSSSMDGYFDNPAETNTTLGFERAPQSDTRPEVDNMAGRLTLQWLPEGSTFEATLRASLGSFEDSGAGDLYERLCAAGRTTALPTYGVPEPYADCRVNGRNSTADIPAPIAATMPYLSGQDTYSDHDSYNASLTLEWALDRLSITSITGGYGFDQADANSFNGATAGVYVSQDTSFDQFSQEIRLLTDFGGPVNAMVGLYYSEGDFEFGTAALIAPLPVDPATGRYDSFQRLNGFDSETMSAFTEVIWQITDQLELAGGARWTDEEKETFAENVYAHPLLAAAFPLVRFEDEFEDDNVSPQVTLTWRPRDDFMVYGAYKEGYKSGGYNTSLNILATTTREEGEFGSESAQGAEIGIKAELFDRTLQLNGVVYAYDYDDLQVQVFDADTTGQRVDNVGTLETQGVEVDFNALVPAVEGLSLRGALSWNQAEYEDYIGACYAGQTIAEGCNLDPGAGGAFNSQDYSGRTAPKAPEWNARLGASWERDLGNGLRLALSADAAYTDEYNFTDALRPDAVQDSFTRVDASVRLMSADLRWEVALIGRNIGDELVVTSANDMPAQGAGGTGTATGLRSDMNTIVERGREVYLQAKVRL